MKTGLFIGRFQPFHKGHLDAVKHILKEVDRLIIGIGSSQYSGTFDNPFTAEERKEMIKKVLKDSCEIVFIPDIHDEKRWGGYVEKVCPKFDVVYTGSRYTKRCFEILGKYPIKNIKEISGISATEVRKRIKKGNNWQELVPAEVAEEIIRINGIERIKNV